MPKRNIVFDLGGVLIDWNPRYLYRKMFDSNEKMEYFLAEVCTSEWNVQQDAGRDFEDGIKELLPDHPEFQKEIEAYYSRWEEMLGGAILGTVEILKDFHESGDHSIYALTNWSRQTFPIALKQFDFLHWFEDILVSGEEGMKKPDEEIYQLMLKRFNLPPSNTVFIDDSLPNVEAARKLAITGIHYQNPEQLKAELEKMA